MRFCRSGMLYPRLSQTARYHPWGVAADAHAVVCGIRRRSSVECIDNLTQKPGPTLRFIDPDLDKARSCHIFVVVADIVGCAKESRELPVVGKQFSQHCFGGKVKLVIVFEPLMACHIADRVESDAPQLPDALCNGVGHGEY